MHIIISDQLKIVDLLFTQFTTLSDELLHDKNDVETTQLSALGQELEPEGERV